MIPVVPLEPVGKHTSPTIPIVAVTQALDIRVWVNIVLQSILGERLQGVPFNNHPVIMLTIILENVPTRWRVRLARTMGMNVVFRFRIAHILGILGQLASLAPHT